MRQPPATSAEPRADDFAAVLDAMEGTHALLQATLGNGPLFAAAPGVFRNPALVQKAEAALKAALDTLADLVAGARPAAPAASDAPLWRVVGLEPGGHVSPATAAEARTVAEWRACLWLASFPRTFAAIRLMPLNRRLGRQRKPVTE